VVTGTAELGFSFGCTSSSGKGLDGSVPLRPKTVTFTSRTSIRDVVTGMMHPYFGVRTQARSGRLAVAGLSGVRLNRSLAMPLGLGRGLAIDAPQRHQRPTLPTLLMLVQCH